MVVKDWMRKSLITVEADEGISAAWRKLKENKIRHLPVMEKGKLVGIVTDRDLRQALPSPVTSLSIYEIHYLLDRVKVREVMTRYLITVGPETPIEEVAHLLVSHRVGGLPVVDGEKLVGIITETDVLQAFVEVIVRQGASTAA